MKIYYVLLLFKFAVLVVEIWISIKDCNFMAINFCVFSCTVLCGSLLSSVLCSVSDVTMSCFQGGATLAAVDRWCVGSHPVTEYLPDSSGVTPSLPSFLWCWRMVDYIWNIWAAVCHICWSGCHVLYWQDVEEKVQYCVKPVSLAFSVSYNWWIVGWW